MRQFKHDNGLSLVMFGLFALFLVAQSIAGLVVYKVQENSTRVPRA